MENSFQQTYTTGNVTGWYTVPVSSTVCDTGNIANYGNAAAQNAGYVLSNYQHLVYIFPNNACSWWGLSTIGGSPSQSWIRDYTNSTSGVALMNLTHELGHGLGLYHSHGWNCTSYPSNSCSSNEYGDTLDVMGNIDYVSAPHYNAQQKELLGWLNYSAQPPIVTVGSSGTYSLAPYESQDSGTKALKVAQANGQYYYIEKRTSAGYDSFLSGNSNVLNGVVLHLATPGYANTSQLLDIPSPSAESLSPALAAGQQYTDSTANVSITPVSAGSTGASVQVTVGPATCVQANPTVSISGPTSSVAPGAQASFTVSVRNNDTSLCTTSTFSLGSSVPSGWTGSYTSSALILAPGGNGSTTILVTAPQGTPNGTYSVSATATNSSTGYAGSASANETIYTAPPVTVTVTTNQSTYTSGSKIVSTATVLSGALPVTGVSVTMNITKADGSIVRLNGTTNSNGAATVTYQIKKQDPAGTWNATGSYSNGSANKYFTVQ
jgi:hypothetical protein